MDPMPHELHQHTSRSTLGENEGPALLQIRRSTLDDCNHTQDTAYTQSTSSVDGSVAVQDEANSHPSMLSSPTVTGRGVEPGMITMGDSALRKTIFTGSDDLALLASENSACMQAAQLKEVPRVEATRLGTQKDSTDEGALLVEGHSLKTSNPVPNELGNGTQGVSQNTLAPGSSTHSHIIAGADDVLLGACRNDDYVLERAYDTPFIPLPTIEVTDEYGNRKHVEAMGAAHPDDMQTVKPKTAPNDERVDASATVVEPFPSVACTVNESEGAYMHHDPSHGGQLAEEVARENAICEAGVVSGSKLAEDNSHVLECKLEDATEVGAISKILSMKTRSQDSPNATVLVSDISPNPIVVEDLVSLQSDDSTESKTGTQLPILANSSEDSEHTPLDGLLPPLPPVVDHLFLLGETCPSLPDPLAPALPPELADLTLPANDSTTLEALPHSCLGLTLHADENAFGPPDTLQPITADSASLPAATLPPLLPDHEPSALTETSTGTIVDLATPKPHHDVVSSTASDTDLPATSAFLVVDATHASGITVSSEDDDTPRGSSALVEAYSSLHEFDTGPLPTDVMEETADSLEALLEVSISETGFQDLPEDLPPDDAESPVPAQDADATGDVLMSEESFTTPIRISNDPVARDFAFPVEPTTDVLEPAAAEEEIAVNGVLPREEANDEDPPSPGLPPSSPPSSQVSDLVLPPNEKGAEDEHARPQERETVAQDKATGDDAARDVDDSLLASPFPSSQPRSSSPSLIFSSPPPYDLSSPPSSPPLLPKDELKSVTEDIAMLHNEDVESKASTASAPEKKRLAEGDLREDGKRMKTIERYTPPPPPNPKRPTLLGQKKQHRKLVQPFRSPIVKLDGILAGKDGVYASGRARSAQKRVKSEPREDVTPSDDFGASTRPAIDSDGARTKAAATKDRTARAGKPFKSLVLHPGKTDVYLTTAGATSGVKTGSTVQALQGRVQKLKQALRIRNEHEAAGEQRLEVLVAKWRSVARDVAWLVWDTVKDLDPGDSLKALPFKGGWGNDDDVGRADKSKGRKVGDGFQAGWGWDGGKGGDGKHDGFDSNWGWDDKKENGGDSQADRVDGVYEQMDVEIAPVQNHSLGTMLRHMGIDPETLGWDEDEGDFIGEP